MTDRTYDTESLHTAESRKRDARFVGHEPKGSKMTERVDPETVTQLCYKVIGHVADGKALWDADFGSIIDTLRALLAERDALEAESGKIEAAIIMADPAFDGDSEHETCADRLVASVERLRAEMDRLRDENDGALAIIATERAEVLKLRAEADLHQQALEDAEARGYARAIEEAARLCADAFAEQMTMEIFEEEDSARNRESATSMAEKLLHAIRALSPTPADPVAEAAKVLADHMKERRWQYYPIEMPLTKDGQGPATLGDDAVSVSYEVWEAGTLRAVSSHECLPDAIEAALRALAEQEGER